MIQKDEALVLLKNALIDYQHWLTELEQKRQISTSMIPKIKAIGEAVGACIEDESRLSYIDLNHLVRALELTKGVVLYPQIDNTKELSDLGNYFFEKRIKPHWKILGLDLVNLGLSALMLVSVFSPALMPVGSTLGLHVAKLMVDGLISNIENMDKSKLKPEQQLKENIDSLTRNILMKH